MSELMKKIILLSILLVLVSACGRKAPPVAWETIVPKRIVDLEAVSREGRLILTWTAPKENTDKSVLTDLTEFKVLKSEGTLVAGECRGCGGKPEVLLELRVEGKEEDARGKKFSISIEDLEAMKVYVYTVVSVNKRGHPGSPSNPVQVFWDYPPHRPTVVRGERGDKRADLSWEPVEGATGYNIYRRGENEDFTLRPLNRQPLTATQYTDLNVENEKKYIYSIRAVKQVAKTEIEGRGSFDISVTPTDLIPPGSPVGLVAVPLRNGVELNWRKNPEPDLLGYDVYRRRPGEAEFKRLNDTPLKKETYLDTEVDLGQDYEYAVSAVDNSVQRNASPLSEEVSVKYLIQ